MNEDDTPLKEKKTEPLDQMNFPENQPVTQDIECIGGLPTYPPREKTIAGIKFLVAQCSSCERDVFHQPVNRFWVHGAPIVAQ